MIESYVDDIFGGANEKQHAECLKQQLIETGVLTTATPNLEKCHGPTQKLAILGMTFDAVLKKVSLPERKQRKYLSKINEILSHGHASSKTLEKVVGYLV